MKEIHEIRAEREEKMSALFKKHGVFFAFSKKQFEENKTPLREGEKYVTFLGGGYMPEGNAEEFKKEWDDMFKWYGDEITANGLGEAEVLYELRNHECYYTGDPTPVIDMFDGKFTKEQVLKIFRENSE